MLMKLIFTITALSFFTACISVATEQDNFAELQRQAQAAYAKGKPDEAIALMSNAIAVEPKNPRGYFVRARFHEENREPAKAIADYNQVIKLDPRLPDAWQHRGTEHFKLGHIKESIADFDQFIELVPQQSPYHWQRGISLYYAGRL
jgi:lipoprotein NlpI